MRVLLTGAAGFIGSHIRAALRAGGHEVVAVDLMLPAAHGPGAEPPEGVRQVDVRVAGGLDPLLRGVDVVCHQAAVVGAGVDTQDAPAYAGHNDYGTAVLLAAMERAGCARLVLASSMVVYGEGLYRGPDGIVAITGRRSEDLAAGRFEHRYNDADLVWAPVPEDTPSRPRSLYAASKVAQENYAAAWAAATGGAVTALRYHNVYGPGMPRDTPYSGVAAIFRSALAAGRPGRWPRGSTRCSARPPTAAGGRWVCPIRGPPASSRRCRCPPRAPAIGPGQSCAHTDIGSRPYRPSPMSTTMPTPCGSPPTAPGGSPRK